jgi:hypothetical protein
MAVKPMLGIVVHPVTAAIHVLKVRYLCETELPAAGEHGLRIILDRDSDMRQDVVDEKGRVAMEADRVVGLH